MGQVPDKNDLSGNPQFDFQKYILQHSTSILLQVVILFSARIIHLSRFQRRRRQ